VVAATVEELDLSDFAGSEIEAEASEVDGDGVLERLRDFPTGVVRPINSKAKVEYWRVCKQPFCMVRADRIYSNFTQ